MQCRSCTMFYAWIDHSILLIDIFSQSIKACIAIIMIILWRIGCPGGYVIQSLQDHGSLFSDDRPSYAIVRQRSRQVYPEADSLGSVSGLKINRVEIVGQTSFEVSYLELISSKHGYRLSLVISLFMIPGSKA